MARRVIEKGATCFFFLLAVVVVNGNSGGSETDYCPTLTYGENCTKKYDRSQIVWNRDRCYMHMDYWLFYDEHTHTQFMGHNIFEVSHGNETTLDLIYKELSPDLDQLNNQSCGRIYRKTTGYCSECVSGYAPAIYRYYGIPCTKCHKNSLGWLWYILLEVSFPTAMFFIFLLLRVRITTGFMIGFIFYCQVIANTFTRPYFYHLLSKQNSMATHVLLSIYGLWNMDFFRFLIPKFCVNENLGTLSTVALGYVSAFYPLLLTGIVYSLMRLHQRGCRVVVAGWRPFHRWYVILKQKCQRDEKASLIDTLAAFLLLSYSKILSISLLLSQPLNLYSLIQYNHQLPNHITSRSLDPGVGYGTDQHIAYMTLAIVILLMFIVIPPAVLCIHPTRWGKNLFSKWWLTASKDFNRLVSSFQVGFKNGEGDSTDYRAVAVIHIVHRVVIFFTYVFLDSHNFLTFEPFLMQASLYICTFAFYSYAQPYKIFWHNCVELVLLALLTVQSLICFRLYGACPYEGTNIDRCRHELERMITFQYYLLCAPPLCLLVYLILKGKNRVTLFLSRFITRKSCFRRHGYQPLNVQEEEQEEEREETSLEAYS